MRQQLCLIAYCLVHYFLVLVFKLKSSSSYGLFSKISWHHNFVGCIHSASHSIVETCYKSQQKLLCTHCKIRTASIDHGGVHNN